MEEISLGWFLILLPYFFHLDPLKEVQEPQIKFNELSLFCPDGFILKNPHAPPVLHYVPGVCAEIQMHVQVHPINIGF